MNQALSALAREIDLAAPEHEPLRLAFGLACAARVAHLLEDPRAIAGLAVLRRFVAGTAGIDELRSTRAEIETAANHHRGSNSIDGSAHAAVSATYALANALAGRALEAASYAAYATVYAYGGYAVTEPTAFEPEFTWQLDELRRLAQAHQPTPER
jgi:hypothetical protein